MSIGCIRSGPSIVYLLGCSSTLFLQGCACSTKGAVPINKTNRSSMSGKPIIYPFNMSGKMSLFYLSHIRQCSLVLSPPDLSLAASAVAAHLRSPNFNAAIGSDFVPDGYSLCMAIWFKQLMYFRGRFLHVGLFLS